MLTNQPGKESWPITGATFILMHKSQKDPQKAKQVLDFFDWAYRNGDQMAEELHYVPMPRKGDRRRSRKCGRRKSSERTASRSGPARPREPAAMPVDELTTAPLPPRGGRPLGRLADADNRIDSPDGAAMTAERTAVRPGSPRRPASAGRWPTRHSTA